MLVFSYHVAIIPFSWKFGFDKLSKYDELCWNRIVHIIRYAYIVQSTSDIIAVYNYSVNKYCKVKINIHKLLKCMCVV